MSKQRLKKIAVFLGLLFTVSSAFSTPNMDGQWLNRSKDFSLVVWTMGSVVCGYLNEAGGRDGRGNNSFFVGRLGKDSTEVAFDSPYAEGRGTASLSLVGDELKWRVIKDIPGGYTPSEERLGRVPTSGFFNQDDLEHDKSQCIEWRRFIKSGNIEDLELQEIGGYKRNLHLYQQIAGRRPTAWVVPKIRNSQAAHRILFGPHASEMENTYAVRPIGPNLRNEASMS